MDSTCCAAVPSFFSESTGLYFYSAVFQGNMALLALLGVFIVYRRQFLSSRREFLETMIYHRWRDIHRLVGMNIPQSEPFDIVRIVQVVDDLHNSNSPQIDPNQISFELYLKKLKPHTDSYKAFERMEKICTKGFWGNTLLMISIIVYSLVGLLVAVQVHSIALPIELILFVLAVILQIVVLIKLSGFISTSIDDKISSTA